MEDRLPTSLILICAAGTPMARTGGFAAADEPLDESGRRDAAAVSLPERFRRAVLASPAHSARETADAMRLTFSEEPTLADIGHGDWAGHAFGDIAAEALGGWIADPMAGAPGGETMPAVQRRVATWLDGVAAGGGAVCAITHATVIRAALAHALSLPLSATLRIDIAPLSHARLSFNGQWRLQALGALN